MNDIEKDELEAIGTEPWMETFSGKKFFLFDKEGLDQIDIYDIAHSLALNCRYNGHCSRFYSVAEHSVLMSYLVPEGLELEGLLHDSTEAYLSDIVRPFKRVMPMYQDIENTLYTRIASKYGLADKIHAETKEVDLAICKLEAETLMMSKGKGWGLDSSVITNELLEEKSGYSKIPCWSPEQAEQEFLSRFYELVS